MNFASSSAVEEIVQNTQGFSGADLQGLVNNIQMISIQGHLNRGKVFRTDEDINEDSNVLSQGSLRDGPTVESGLNQTCSLQVLRFC